LSEEMSKRGYSYSNNCAPQRRVVGVKEGYPENYTNFKNNNLKIVRRMINIDL
jgi:hypothetical protein